MKGIKLTQSRKLPTEKRIRQTAAWVMVFPTDMGISNTVPYAKILIKRYRQFANKMPSKTPIQLDLPEIQTHISFAVINANIDPFNCLTLGRKLVAELQYFIDGEVGILVYGFQKKFTETITEALVSSVLAAHATLPSYKKSAKKQDALKCITLFGHHADHGYQRSLAAADGNALARQLSMLPPNYLTPASYLSKIRQLSKKYHWKLDFYNIASLKKKRAGAFLAVAQGSPTADAGIVRLRYQPKKTSKPSIKIALVGKGLCYDTGGVNLKPASAMYGMHEDMQGSAIALGSLVALTQMDYPHSVECWLALATNHIGPKAYKPNDVITAIDGTTIEIIHTDAEGRMVLADTLALASQQHPLLIIDYATLTGACIYALGNAYSGIFTNHKSYLPTLVDTGKNCGERVWPFPLDDDYQEYLKSDIADIKQCAQENGMDHILAACFLKHFIKHDIPWVHIDLASSHKKGGLAHIPTATTGFGVRYTLALLLDGAPLYQK